MDKSDEKESAKSDPEQKGSFATGSEDLEHHPEDADEGDFAEGQEKSPTTHEHRHEGSFATGEEDTEHHPEDLSKGDFATGQEKEDRP
jgi:hypothetical protein